MFTVTIGCIVGSFLIEKEGIYSLSKEKYLEEHYTHYIHEDTHYISGFVNEGKIHFIQKEQLDKWFKKKNFAKVTVWQGYTDATLEIERDIWKIWEWTNENVDPGYSEKITIYSPMMDYSTNSISWIRANITLAKEPLAVEDNYYNTYRLASFLYTIRYKIPVIGLITFLLSILGYARLMYTSGRYKNEEGVRTGWGTAIPFDLLTMATTFVLFLLSKYISKLFHGASSPMILTILIPLVILSESIFLGWSMSFALRIKLGQWWKNTLIFQTRDTIKKVVTSSIRKFTSGLLTVVNHIPFIAKTIIAFATITIIEFIFILIFINYYYTDEETILYFWIIEKVILVPLILYVAITLHKLQQGGNALVHGDFTYQIDTKYMFWDMKQHGENLNNIANGMALAVEERMKSERLKTELITNVSHDIKTPLTSIINYADLLNKEVSGNFCETPSNNSNDAEIKSMSIALDKAEKIQAYSSTLHRHSERLKRLIEDLIEASKAATGTMEVNLEPCDTAILLTQASGEYEQRMTSAGLTLVTKYPEQSVPILADGRRLWRVFDNLLNNICKYAQNGTRVYLTLEEKNNFAVITFKNTSRDALDVSADELMERFVRGDASRHTEGNGLGLAIAKSLTELQNGSMEIMIDGDFFKVMLKFPIHKMDI